MDFLGIWKLKAMLSADENGVKMLGKSDLEALGDEDILKMLRADFIISENAIDVYYMPTEEEGWELTDKGVLIESYPIKIENGVLMLDYERTGEYVPVEADAEGCLLIGGMTKIEKV